MRNCMILPGGGLYGIQLLGALHYMHTHGILDFGTIDTYIGTSVGSLIALCLAVGYTPSDIFMDIHTSALLEQMAHIEPMNVLHGRGLVEFDVVSKCITRMVTDKLGYVPTMHDLWVNTGIQLQVVYFSLQAWKTVVVDHTSTLSVVDAVTRSSGLPLIFDPVVDATTGDVCIDGSMGYNTLGIRCVTPEYLRAYDRIYIVNLRTKPMVQDTSRTMTHEQIVNLWSHHAAGVSDLYHDIFTRKLPLCMPNSNKVLYYEVMCTVYRETTPSMNLASWFKYIESSIKSTRDVKTRLNMFTEGYESVQSYIKKHN